MFSVPNVTITQLKKAYEKTINTLEKSRICLSKKNGEYKEANSRIGNITCKIRAEREFIFISFMHDLEDNFLLELVHATMSAQKDEIFVKSFLEEAEVDEILNDQALNHKLMHAIADLQHLFICLATLSMLYEGQLESKSYN
ncbi:hypothetical protein J7E78_11975 [Paenibacillus polymyxa]|uniref:hypothetical protein n=1 Tax=Paenibacillus polymyxa TaxID=1406 RepID=UPI001BE7C71B|nr:hypothetical protein [Paenibacillus polymyxa]MBT2284255.1 hypothetical protein [Paenibacillus polymyxa]